MADFKTMFLRILWILLVMKSVDSVGTTANPSGSPKQPMINATIKAKTPVPTTATTTVPTTTQTTPPATTLMAKATTVPSTTSTTKVPSTTSPTKSTTISSTTSPTILATAPSTTSTTVPSIISPTTATVPKTNTETNPSTIVPASNPVPTMKAVNITATPIKTTKSKSETTVKSTVIGSTNTPSPTTMKVPIIHMDKSSQAPEGTESGGHNTEETNSVETTVSIMTTTSKPIKIITETSPQTMPTKGTTEAQNGSKSKSKSYDRELVIIFGVMLGLMFVVIVIFGIHKCRHRNKESDDLPMSSADKYRNGGEDVTIAASSF